MQRVDSSKEGLDCVWPKNDEVYEISFKFVKQINLGAQAGGGGGGFWKDHILFRGMEGGISRRKQSRKGGWQLTAMRWGSW